MYDDFMEGMEPLLDDDVAEAAAFMIGSEERVSVTSISVTPTAQRTLQVCTRAMPKSIHLLICHRSLTERGMLETNRVALARNRIILSKEIRVVSRIRKTRGVPTTVVSRIVE